MSQGDLFNHTHQNIFPVFHVKYENERIIAKSTHFHISIPLFNVTAAV